MIDEHHEELASLYVLGLLEDEERRAFEAALAEQPELRALVDQLRDTSAALAHTAPAAEPPRRLKSRILAALETASAPAPAAAVFALPAWVSWSIAAGFAVVAAWIGQLYLATRAENTRLADERTIANFEAQTARNQLAASAILSAREKQQVQSGLKEALAGVESRDEKIAVLNRKIDALTGASADAGKIIAEAKDRIAALEEQLRTETGLAQFKIATLTSMLGNTPQAVAVAVWSPERQQGVLKVAKLPALADDQDYQLWVIDPQYPIPVDGGVFRVDPATGEARVEFRPDKPVMTAAKFAISLERRGGVPKAEGPIVLLGE